MRNHCDHRSSYCLFTEPSAPYIQINVSKPLKVVKGTVVTLPCFATGSPIPFVKWWSDDGKESSPCNVTCHDIACINFTCYWNVIVFGNTTYWCEAKNIYGVIRRNVSVEVLGDMFWFMCYNPTNIYLFKVNHRSTRKRYEICPKLLTATERRQWCRSPAFIANFEHSSYLFLVFLLLTLTRLIFAGKEWSLELICKSLIFRMILKKIIWGFLVSVHFEECGKIIIWVCFYLRLHLLVLSFTLHRQVSIQFIITGELLIREDYFFTLNL